MQKAIARIAVRTGISPLDLLECDIEMLDEITALLQKEQQHR